jgi:hypothetical protein
VNYHSYQLKTSADFDNAIYFESLVSITQDGSHVSLGIIRSHCDNVVKLHEEQYLKSHCVFTVYSLINIRNRNT